VERSLKKKKAEDVSTVIISLAEENDMQDDGFHYMRKKKRAISFMGERKACNRQRPPGGQVKGHKLGRDAMTLWGKNEGGTFSGLRK